MFSQIIFYMVSVIVLKNASASNIQSNKQHSLVKQTPK